MSVTQLAPERSPCPIGAAAQRVVWQQKLATFVLQRVQLRSPSVPR